MDFPRLSAVEPIAGKRLRVTFADGTIKIYDCTHLLETQAFRPLKDEAFFRRAHVEPHGYAVVWNDQVDLAESELWLHGVSPTIAEPRQAVPGAAAQA